MAENKTKVVPLTEEQLITKEAELNARDEKLNSEIKEFENFQEGVHQLAEETKLKIEAFEAEKKAFETEKNTITPKAEKRAAGEKLKFEDANYQFTDDAPESILLNGKATTQKEIAKDEELIVAILSFGLNTGLITKI